MITATLFRRPNGHTSEIEVTKINPEDADYINANNIGVSLEDCGPFITIWFDDGKKLDGEPDEVIVVAGSDKTCEQAMAEGVARIKARA